MNKLVQQMAHLTDMIGIVFCLLGAIYLSRIKNRTPEENLLFAGCILGFFADSTYTFFYLQKSF
jgi:hypothetical protein